MDGLKYFLSSLADLALPRSCIVCGRDLETRENHLCIYCAADFPFTRFWTSDRNEMADRLNSLISRDMLAEERETGYERYSYAAALFFYHSGAGYRKIPQALKYRKRIAAGQYFAHMLGDRIFSSPLFRDVDLIIPVPLHWRRKWERGYNQAEIIAAALADLCGCPVCNGMLKRNRYSVSQTKLPVGEKQANVRKAFGVVPETARAYSPSHILVVDDVFTTGATVNACHAALRKHFGSGTRISIATLGFVCSE